MIENMLKSEVSNIELSKVAMSEIKSRNGKFVSGMQLTPIRIAIRLRMLGLILRNYSSPNDWIHALKYLIALRKNILGTPKIKKVAKVNGNYYMGIYTASWFSKEFDQFILSHLNDYKPIKRSSNRFDSVFISVTNRCPLRCEHCYNWTQFNGNKRSSIDNLSSIIEKLQSEGVGHIQFLGGEPLLEYEYICNAVKSARKTSEFWITTSGFSLNEAKARKLKDSGIRGVIVSLDHYDRKKHNQFRNHKDAYDWAINAVKNAINANLIVALSVCITKEFLTPTNLKKYMDQAKELGVMFVQFLEPKSVGHYESKDVALTKNRINELEQFFLKNNFSSSYLEYPIIIYPGYHQRREGCMLAGKKSIYIDTNGIMNPCPFCHKPYGKVLKDGFNLKLQKMVNQGCVKFLSANL